ncbi:exoribonuclease [Microdochium trichocladiopsis]|uniref:5'-3' exoribonuclease 1 n=1 Tax=Microdochium trichocladiopsis TaxID=1682393 RepID=A0A9P8Y8L2_9PEZI|nr:exoribonuclease [Microdochium trichocladiopsis]KAH7032973.1 exoribonuclease [Microdochium trichocladiopsis]
MGVPKFFRWLSERYPAISQVIAENRIPEFDNLYLDMNGIIHNCTHKDSDDATFRLSEDEMFIRIFNYIEHLFGKIKPKKLFFMAIDGVAPRAKMNQQRSRRFRTARDAEEARDKAIREGQEMPKEPPFDSNCITPGTEFMAKLTQQLKYFINKKISEDSDWQGCDIVLSGHEVPGEGEHKIMEYIRNAKAQPDYPPNVRHCLYGLDADLIMLGLLSHDPHFCLLREEVTFGRASKTKSKDLEHQNFYLLHLCIVREYLELEFQDLKTDNTLKFPFDLERVIDDFILMAFFVGNDFLPNLPFLHINEGALSTMFRLYKQVLPQCEGYINEGGVINFPRLGLLLDELSKEEKRHFEHENADSKWMRSKQLSETNGRQPIRQKGNSVVITTSQKEIWKTIRKFLTKKATEPLDLGHQLNAEDRKFVQDVASNLNLEWTTTSDDDGLRHLVVSPPPKPEADGEDDDEEEDEEGQLALMRAMRKYDNAQVVDVSNEEAQEAMAVKYKEKFLEWKDSYYAGKFEWAPEEKVAGLKGLAENYVQGLQWVLFYYYRGVASWPWYYAYHYSPMTSDISKGFGADLDFKLGQPFRPFEQLMGVLPDRSKSIVPTVYHDLMTNPKSPIVDFYPRDFELDMNGKKQDWEAVVKIPFIDEKRLLEAMAAVNDKLSPDEKARNGYGVSLKFTYDNNVNFTYPSSMVGIFPDIPSCKCVENIFDLPTADGLELYVGLPKDAKIGVDALAGFPSLATLPYNATLGFHGVTVFQQESRNESMVVTLADVEERSKVSAAKLKLGKRCFVGYPFLQEAKIVQVSDELHDYILAPDGQIIAKEHSHRDIEEFGKKSNRTENFYSKRLGVITGPVEAMVKVDMLKGLIKMDDGAMVKEYGDIPGMETDYAAQVIVDSVISEDERFIERAAIPIEEEFPPGSRAFFLGEYAYGRPLEVAAAGNNKADIALSIPTAKDIDFAGPIIKNAIRQNPYRPSYAVAKDLGIHPLVLSKITSSFFINTIGGSMKVNLGLNLKFDGRKQKVLGYSRKSQTGWEFSPAAIRLLVEYMTNFPDFFAAILRNPQGKEFDDVDLWPDQETATTRVKAIGQWLKTKETSKFERVPLDAEQLDSDVVIQLQAKIDELRDTLQKAEVRRMKGVPRAALLHPRDAEQRLGNQTFGLGDRVIYVADSGKVPIASTGTVVGISEIGAHRMLDVLCDRPFMNGTTLGGRCEAFRGQTVSANAVLNLSYKQVVWHSSKSAQKQQPQRQTPQYVSGYGSSSTQYRDANAPAPLRGTWRGAVNGSRDGQPGRGRGGSNGVPNLQHSSLVYRPLPEGHQNHPQQQQQQVNGRARGGGAPRGGGRGGRGAGSGQPNGQPHATPNGTAGYTAVPPPAGLDAPGRGGGRGGRGGRGRGGRGRGGGGRGGRGESSQGQQAA